MKKISLKFSKKIEDFSLELSCGIDEACGDPLKNNLEKEKFRDIWIEPASNLSKNI